MCSRARMLGDRVEEGGRSGHTVEALSTRRSLGFFLLGLETAGGGEGGRGAWSVWDSCDPSPFTPPASGLRRSFGQGWGGVFLSEPRAAGVKLGQGSWELGPVPGGWQCVSLRSWE